MLFVQLATEDVLGNPCKQPLTECLDQCLKKKKKRKSPSNLPQCIQGNSVEFPKLQNIFFFKNDTLFPQRIVFFCGSNCLGYSFLFVFTAHLFSFDPSKISGVDAEMHSA